MVAQNPGGSVMPASCEQAAGPLVVPVLCAAAAPSAKAVASTPTATTGKARPTYLIQNFISPFLPSRLSRRTGTCLSLPSTEQQVLSKRSAYLSGSSPDLA